jgi:hypothetical protein
MLLFLVGGSECFQIVHTTEGNANTLASEAGVSAIPNPFPRSSEAKDRNRSGDDAFASGGHQLADKNALNVLEGDYYYDNFAALPGEPSELQPNIDDDITNTHYRFGSQNVHLHGIGVGTQGGIAHGELDRAYAVSTLPLNHIPPFQT